MSTETRHETEAPGRLEYEAFEDRECRGDWRVEAIDHPSEGECYVAIFSGPGAEARAREYAAWKGAHGEGSRGGLNGPAPLQET